MATNGNKTTHRRATVEPRGLKFWRNLKQKHNTTNNSSSNGNNKDTRRPRHKGGGPIAINKLNEHHLTIDQLVARRKLEQLRLLTRTDLAILNSAEPYRVSGYAVFKRNLLDPLLHLSVCSVYLVCKLLAHSSNRLSFVVLFALLFALLNHHIESYRSHVLVRQSVDKLSNNYELRRRFLSTHLGYDPRIKREQANDHQPTAKPDEPHGRTAATGGCWPKRQHILDEPEALEGPSRDSFRWINRIILFFWPYLSHLIHYELNEFFREKIESGSMGRSEQGTGRLFYAIIRQLDTNVLVIERCQLGAQTPLIKGLTAREGASRLQEVAKRRGRAKTATLTKGGLSSLKTVLSDLISPPSEGRRGQPEDKTNEKDNGKVLVYNLNLVYNGDMDISVIYRYFCCCSSRVGLKDVFLRFNVQITLGPISKELPFIDEVRFTLLEKPSFGYKGIALAELAELKIVRQLINRIIKDHLLAPRQVTVSLRELMETIVNGPGKASALGSASRRAEPAPTTTKKEPQSVSRIEPHPGKIMSASEPPVSLSPQTIGRGRISFWTRLQANALICGCLSANFLLRCCQCFRQATDDTRPVSASRRRSQSAAPTGV